MKTIAHKRLNDFHSFDKIELKVIPRFKQSGLSGDEWRSSVRVDFYFKGHIVYEAGFRDMKTALMLLPREWTAAQEPIPMKIIEMEKMKCDQPGCMKNAVVTFKIKEKFSDRGERLDPSDGLASWTEYRRFCEEHKHRGDSSREDCDANYEEMGIG